MRSCFGTETLSLRAGPAFLSEARHRPRLRTPVHEHDFACLHVVLGGCYEESTRRGTERAEPGAVVFKPAGERHWNSFPEAGAWSLRMQVDAGVLPELHRHLPSRLVVLRDPRLGLLGHRLRQELRWGDDLTPLAVEPLVMELLVATARTQRAAVASAGRRLAPRCKGYLDENFRGSVALSSAAQELGVHRAALARAFRKVYGMSVGDYVRRLRVRWVADALESDPDRSLADLALDAGFADQSHLTRTFKLLVGVPPGRYRSRIGRGTATPVPRATFVQDPG